MRFLAEEKLEALLHLLAKSSSLWTPTAIEDAAGTVTFEPWKPGTAPVLDRFTTLSAKELLLPATEKLFSFTYSLSEGEESVEIEPEGQTGETILFGARACDAKAIKVLDALFMQPAGEAYGDDQYRRRRLDLTVITIACTTCDAACFCSSFENGPAEKSGSDVFLYPVEGGWIAEGITDRGGDLIGGDSFTDSGIDPPELVVTRSVDIAGLQEKLPEIFANIDFWQEATAKCLSCGYCTYTCPTCYCFNIFDEMRSDREGERLRGWDACIFNLYTRETSGHNPRPTIAKRYRNRIGHKFSYYPANQGETLCTGCGRCIRGCPAGLDIRDVLTGVKEL
ncbi:MAG: 4Fe-4S dicluster domain-containing protein [Thermoleophilia bacterium]